MSVSIKARFHGCLLGLAVGDALGGRFEAQSAEFIRSRYPTTEHLVNSGTDELWYTDDTQMAIGIAETLADHSTVIERHLCEAFVANYTPTRGYGRGARAVLDAMEEGRDYRTVAQRHFPGGSYGNGAAMRVAPIGLFFRDDYSTVLDQSRLSALPTHVHPLGIEGAQLLALAVAIASRMNDFDQRAFYAELLDRAESSEYTAKIRKADEIRSSSDLESLGNGIEAVESVPTAIACFALNSKSYEQTIGDAILLGGDTDTIAAMAGAISGAHLGVDAIPSTLLDRLETSPKGRTYIAELADRLYAAFAARKQADCPTVIAGVTFLSADEGGRRIPLTRLSPTYRPHLVIQSPDVREPSYDSKGVSQDHYLAVCFQNTVEELQPGQQCNVTLQLIGHPKVDYDEAVPGATFTIREGGRVVGFGQIISRHDPPN